MIYEVQKGTVRIEADDTVPFGKHPEEFIKLFNDTQHANIADFDNCTAYLLESGRVLFTLKPQSDEI